MSRKTPNSKRQAPSRHERDQAPNPKSQKSSDFQISNCNRQVGGVFWNLEFDVSLELGIWDLGFGISVRWGGRRDSNPQQQAPQAWTLPLSYDHHPSGDNRFTAEERQAEIGRESCRESV